MWYAYFNTKYFVMQEILTLIVQFAQKNVSKKSVAAIFIAFSFVFQEISRCKNVTFYAKGVPAVSNFCRRSMILQNCVKNIAQTMFRRCRLQTAKRFCRFAGFCGTVCKTMSFSLTAAEFVCSTLPLLFEFCIAQFFCTVCVIFYLDGNFVMQFLHW